MIIKPVARQLAMAKVKIILVKVKAIIASRLKILKTAAMTKVQRPQNCF